MMQNMIKQRSNQIMAKPSKSFGDISEEAFFNPDYIVPQLTIPFAFTMLSNEERTKLINLESRMKARIAGQTEAIEQVCKCIKRVSLGLRNPDTVKAAFLFSGRTAVGKTHFAKVLSEELYGPNRLIRLDMGQFSDVHDASKLLGSAPGYTGFEMTPAFLTDLMARPSSVVLLDEACKACKKTYDLFLPAFSEGELVSSRGEVVSFRQAIVILTSNLGANEICDKPIGFAEGCSIGINTQNKTDKAIKQFFKPELINRLTGQVYFHNLSHNEVRKICTLKLKEIQEQVKRLGISVSFNERTVDLLSEKGFCNTYGARHLDRTLDTCVSDMLADSILNGSIAHGDNILFTVKNGEFTIEKKTAVKSAKGS
jgi:ATP-dependent Clp protease ATP-binding subunit ClpC